MRVAGEKLVGTIRPDFDRYIGIDFQGARITSDTGFLLMREIVPSTYNLRLPAGDYIFFQLQVTLLEFFRAKTRPENVVGMLGTEVGALFRGKMPRRFLYSIVILRHFA